MDANKIGNVIFINFQNENPETGKIAHLEKVEATLREMLDNRDSQIKRLTEEIDKLREVNRLQNGELNDYAETLRLTRLEKKKRTIVISQLEERVTKGFTELNNILKKSYERTKNQKKDAIAQSCEIDTLRNSIFEASKILVPVTCATGTAKCFSFTCPICYPKQADAAIRSIESQLRQDIEQAGVELKQQAKKQEEGLFSFPVETRKDLLPDVVIFTNVPLPEKLPEGLQNKTFFDKAKERQERIDNTVKELLTDKALGVCPGCGCKPGEFHKKACSLLKPVTFSCMVCHTPVMVTQVKCSDCTKANCPECKGAGVIKDSAAPHIQAKCSKCG